MYVVPTPFVLTEGTTGLHTLIVPKDTNNLDSAFKIVVEFSRIESNTIVISYKFDLKTNKISSNKIINKNAGKKHYFTAYRLHNASDKIVKMVGKK
ncbi:MAG: hypothetical protein LBT07_02685 [Endomicrobium sp.]|jgi:hypothetical protein|nr:hypothetical protein [Endomicrobium sp.]